MAYDAMDRLTYANIPGHGASTWAYDPLDNIRSVTTAPTAGPAYTRNYLYDGSNRLTRINQDGATWGVGTYDARGNLINRNGQALNFDRASRLTSIPGIANYEYDGHGRRTAQWRADGTVRVSLYTLDGRLQGEADNRAVGSTDYVYLGGTLVAKRFQHWSGIPPVVTYLHSDGLGSPVLETDAAGSVLSRERLMSYGGAVDGAVKDAVGYTGHQEDPASGLVYMQQRYYDPVVGRFLSVDPMTTDMQTGWNLNRYSYAANSPYKFIDPDGREIDTSCTGDCTFVLINYSQVPRAQGYAHAYIVVIPAGHKPGVSMVARGGHDGGGRSITNDIRAIFPKLAEFLGLESSTMKLQVRISTLELAPDSKGPQAGGQTIASSSTPVDEIMRQLEAFASAVNAAGVPYDAASGVNSNSFAFDAAEGLTGKRPEPSPDDGYKVPGHNFRTGVPFVPKEKEQ